jgi:hypothetical protein
MYKPVQVVISSLSIYFLKVLPSWSPASSKCVKREAIPGCYATSFLAAQMHVAFNKKEDAAILVLDTNSPPDHWLVERFQTGRITVAWYPLAE